MTKQLYVRELRKSFAQTKNFFKPNNSVPLLVFNETISKTKKNFPLLVLIEISRNNNMMHLPLLVFNDTSFYSSTMRSPSPGINETSLYNYTSLSYFFMRPSNKTFVYNITRRPSTVNQQYLLMLVFKETSLYSKTITPLSVGI